MTTLAQSYQAIHDWLVYAVQGGGLYPFDPTRVRWGTQDFPRAVTPLVTLEVVGDTKMSGTPEHTRNDQTGAWATYTRTTHETTVRVEAWTRYSDTSPQLDNRADIMLDRISIFGSTPGALDILDAGAVGLLRMNTTGVFDEIDGASTIRAASREIVFSRVAVAVSYEDFIETVSGEGTTPPFADPIPFETEL